MKAKCMSKAQRSSIDIISTLPQPIIETVLCLLPIEEAARTSILSRKWRYKWTKIPKLVFDMCTVPERTTEKKKTYDITSARKNMDRMCKLFYAIHQVLLLRQGPIHEFTLSMDADCSCFEIDQIILHLIRNHAVKKLSLQLGIYKYNNLYKLPLCVFSLHQLTDLDLCCIDLDHQPILSEFGSLGSLCLNYVKISAKALLHLLSNCPSLKSFTLATNLIGDKDCTITELFGCLPMIENLTTWGSSVHLWLVLDSELPTALVHLKYFCFKAMCFAHDHGLAFLAVLIKCSPNLEKISLEIDTLHMCCENGMSSAILEQYSDVWLEHLNELEIDSFSNLKPEMEFVKFILARSPKLKKVSIFSVAKSDQELKMLKVLLQAPRASPVEIVIV